MPEVSTKELAKLAGVTPQRISQYVNEGMPRIRRGRYDSESCLEWILAYRDEVGARHAANLDPGDATLAQARLRYVTAQAVGQEKRNDILDGTTVVRERVVTAIRERDSRIISTGDAWASNARTGEERRARENLWHDLRRAIHDTARSIESDLASGDGLAATRIRHARRLGGS